MSRNNQFNLISVLLAILALIMLYLGYCFKMWPPAITGIGFLLLVWALRLLKGKS
jgi:hypothetical protein